ncbi:MAG: lactate utilization protein [Lentihominibacter sp.]
MLVDNVKKANKQKLETIVKNLKKRNIKGYYAKDREEALKILVEMIPEGSTVSRGGSETLKELGILKILEEGDYNYQDPYSNPDPDATKAAKRAAFNADIMLTSANAITLDGEIVNIDGTGNRMAAVIWGPDKVIYVIGANKVAANVHSAVDRIKCDACPPNCLRLGKKTPCASTGVCGECLSAGNTICSHTIVTRFNSIPDRVHVILVNDELGF